MSKLTFISWFTQRSIRTQLLVLAVVIALPALGIIAYTGFERRANDYLHAVEGSQLVVDSIAAQLDQITHEVKRVAAVVANLPDIRNRNYAKARKILHVLQAQHPEYSRIFIADAEGNVWLSSVPLQGEYNISDRLYYKKVKASLAFSSGEHVISKLKKEPTFHMAHPIVDGGRFAGVIIFAFDLDPLRKVIMRSRLPASTNYVITDYNGVIISRGKEVGQEVGKPIKPEELAKMRQGPEKDTYEFTRTDGERRIVSYRKLWLPGETQPCMYVRGGLSKGDALASANRVMLYNTAILVPFVLLAFMVAMLIGTRSIVDKVARLRHVATEIGRGNLDARVGDSVKGGELGDFACAFDGMVLALQAEMEEKQRIQDVLILKQNQLESLNDTLEHRVESALADLRQKDYILVQQNRLSAMGEMIGYIAHQWRQPLNLIGLLAQGVSIDVQAASAPPAQVEREMERILNVVKQMSQTIDDFRDFFRRDKEKIAFSVDDAVGKVLILLQPMLDNKRIECEIRKMSDVTIDGFRNEYIQAVMNIVNNAVEIMIERGIPTPKIDITVDSRGETSVVTIADNGGGIEEGVMARIFDPYFTTKEKSIGTGIGLYMSKVIIENNMGGRVLADNTRHGAAFRVEV